MDKKTLLCLDENICLAVKHIGRIKCGKEKEGDIVIRAYCSIWSPSVDHYGAHEIVTCKEGGPCYDTIREYMKQNAVNKIQEK